jgi:hypothetical protein
VTISDCSRGGSFRTLFQAGRKERDDLKLITKIDRLLQITCYFSALQDKTERRFTVQINERQGHF